MNILVIGNGAREHAIIWKLKSQQNKIFCTIGNAGTNAIAEPVNIAPDDISALLDFAQSNNIKLTVAGSELPLSLGIVDEFMKNNLAIFGPSRSAAKLETSKSFAKDFMSRYNIPTAKFRAFNSKARNELSEYLKKHSYPAVLKADGLAGGKGVVICQDESSALETVSDFFEKRIFGNAGETLVVEEFLEGNELSVFAITDGTDYIVLPPARDHKKILDGEHGKNTGGMGSFAPADKAGGESAIEKIRKRVIEPVLFNMKAEGNEYRGCLYCGLMLDENSDPYVIEFNARFGDPETQVILPLIKSDFLELLLASAAGNLKNYELEVYEKFYCSVVLASKGYPDKFETGKEITGLDAVSNDCLVFHAGTKKLAGGRIVTSGGRVLNVVGKSDTGLKEAIDTAYRNIDLINFENKYYRKDIGEKGL